jgi:hydroxyacylglutathione hydrolase
MPVQWIPGENLHANSFIYGSVLVDAGVLPMAVEQFRDDIDTIVLTHCHYDHIVYLKEIAHMSGAEICIHVQDAPGLIDERKNLAMLFGARAPSVVPTYTIQEGDQVGELEVIHTPGHTPGSICLYNAENRILFSGDTVFTGGGFGRVDFPGGSLTQLKDSIYRLSKLNIDAIFPGHGEPVYEGGNHHINAALRILQDAYE